MKPLDAEKLMAKMLSPFSDEPAAEARYIIAHLAGVEPNRILFSNANINLADMEEITKKRRAGVPLQYILGSWWFYKSEFLVGEGVLIPRQDTETLVEAALDLIKNKGNPDICDLCSGSGCIAISIALEREDSTVTAVEKYEDAYKYLIKNIEHNKAKNVKGVMADVLEQPFGSYDLIVSNPPYIKNSEKEELSAEVLNEPHTALFGGDDGLFFYREITRIWRKALKQGGILAFEVGINEDTSVADILKAEGFKNIAFKTDLLGIQRVVFGTAD